MTVAGFRECYQLPIKFEVDMQEPDDDLMALLIFLNEGRLSYEQVRKEAKQIINGKKYLPHESWFGVFRKP